MHRQTCADRLVFESDGVIKKVEPTHQGIGYLGPEGQARRTSPLRRRSPPLRSTGTRCATTNTSPNTPWTTTTPRSGVRRTIGWATGCRWISAARSGCAERETQFEYATWYYQYLHRVSRTARPGRSLPTAARTPAGAVRWWTMASGGALSAPHRDRHRVARPVRRGLEFQGLRRGAEPIRCWRWRTRRLREFIAPKQQPPKQSAPHSDAGRTGQASCGRALRQSPRSTSTSPISNSARPIAAWTNQGTLGGEFTQRRCQAHRRHGRRTQGGAILRQGTPDRVFRLAALAGGQQQLHRRRLGQQSGDRPRASAS